jgi:hypothetical protein
VSFINPVLSFDSTGNVKFMYIQLFQNPCSVMYEPTQYTNMKLYAYKSRVDL